MKKHKETKTERLLRLKIGVASKESHSLMDRRRIESLRVKNGPNKDLFNKLTEAGVISDWREPNVIRCAPVPLYNSFEDVYRFGEILKNSL